MKASSWTDVLSQIKELCIDDETMPGRQLQALHGTIPTVSSTSTRGRGKKKEVEPALARIAQESPVVSDVIPVAA